MHVRFCFIKFSFQLLHRAFSLSCQGFIPNQAHGFGKSYTETTNMRLKKHFNTLEQNKNKKAENKMADTTLGCKRLKEMAVSPHTGIFNGSVSLFLKKF